MAFDFPKFLEPIPSTAPFAWTAVFQSYDQRNDDLYYTVTVYRAGLEINCFIAQVFIYWAGDDWTNAEFQVRLQRALAEEVADFCPRFIK